VAADLPLPGRSSSRGEGRPCAYSSQRRRGTKGVERGSDSYRREHRYQRDADRPSHLLSLYDSNSFPSPPPPFRKLFRSRPSRAKLRRLDARPVDPRDIRWEVSSPTYRVYFWRRVGGGYRSEEFQLSGASDVRDVLSWAEERAEGSTFTVYALLEIRGELGLVQLAGVDPTASP
jgi:hypothetical protein